MKKLSLLQLKPNQKGRILEIAAGTSLQNKCMAMGLYPGREIKKISHMALKGPVTIKVGSSVWALGHGMAQKITVETL